MMFEAVIDTDSSKSVFLALTAEEEFWDTDNRVVFLGEWCRRYSRRSSWEQLDGKTLPHPWSERSQFRKDYAYIEKVYELVLDQLSDALNDLHGMQNGKRYWRIVIGPWAMLYTGILYERYLSLKTALEKLPTFSTIGLHEEAFQVPRDTTGFINLIIEDRYNLQLYTRILAALGHNPPRKRPVDSGTNPERVNTAPLLKRFVKSGLSAINSVAARYAPVIMHKSYFDKIDEYRLALRTGFKAWPMLGDVTSDGPETAIDPAMRLRVEGLALGEAEFERMLANFIAEDIPVCFLEGFNALQDTSQRNYPAHPQTILSASSWYFDEPFKAWAAGSAEQGTLLAGIQHGGNYGSTPYLLLETHELTISDRFYTWGWERSGSPCKLVQASATKLRHDLMGADNSKVGILYVSNGFPRYFMRPPVTIPQMVNYYNLQRQFFRALQARLHAVTTFRLYVNDYGWDCAEQWRTLYPDLAQETSDAVPFSKSLRDCRLYVCDHLSTTFVESLAADKPSILFWDAVNNEITEEARPYYDLLTKAGILYDSPDAAADAANRVYDDVETWWNVPVRQEARKTFCERFARTSPDMLGEWASELRGLALKGH